MTSRSDFVLPRKSKRNSDDDGRWSGYRFMPQEAIPRDPMQTRLTPLYLSWDPAPCTLTLHHPGSRDLFGTGGTANALSFSCSWDHPFTALTRSLVYHHLPLSIHHHPITTPLFPSSLDNRASDQHHRRTRSASHAPHSRSLECYFGPRPPKHAGSLRTRPAYSR